MSQNTKIILIVVGFILALMWLTSFKPGGKKLSQSQLINKMSRSEMEQIWVAQSGGQPNYEQLNQMTDAELRTGLKANLKSNFCCA